MDSYYVYCNQNKNYFNAVRQGFSIKTFLFLEIWLFKNLFFLTLAFYLFCLKFVHENYPGFFTIFILTTRFLAATYYCKILSFKNKLTGFKLKGIVMSSSEGAAIQRYLDAFES